MTAKITDFLTITDTGHVSDINLSYYDYLKDKKPFKYFSLDNQQLIQEKAYKYIVDTGILENTLYWNWIDTADFLSHVPELVEAMKTVTNSPIKYVSIPSKKVGDVMYPHIDSLFGCRVLFPVRNCQGSPTKFFNLNGNNISLKRNKTNGSILWWDIDNTHPLKEIASVELDKPVVFDPQVPHDSTINSNSTETRFTLTIGFEEEPRSFLYDQYFLQHHIKYYASYKAL